MFPKEKNALELRGDLPFAAPAPVAAKPSAMPPNKRLRPDDLEDPNNRWKPAIQLDEEQAVTVGQLRSAPARAPYYDQLLAKNRILRLQSRR